MNDRVDDAARLDPVNDRPDRISGAGRLIILAFGLVGVAIGFALVDGEGTEPLMLGLLAILAIVGVAMLLLLALGVVRFGGRRPGVDITRGYLDTLGEGALITDGAGRILYANRAYADLTGAASGGEVRAVERLFAGEAKAAEAIYRLAQAVREGKAAEEEVRLPAPLSGGRGGGARWYRIRARPIPSVTGGRTDAAWTVADVTGERAQQESVFQELQHAIDYLDHAPAGFFSAEPGGRIVYLNATLAEWLGIDIAHFEAGSLTLGDIVRGENVSLLAGVLAERGHDRTETIDLDLVKRNGESLPVRLLHRVPVAADGAPGATRTIVLNRSPGEESAEALRAAEVRFTRFFNNTPIAIAAVDRNGALGRTNAAFLRLFKGALGDAKSGRRKLVDLVAEGDREAIATASSAAARRPGVIPPIDAVDRRRGRTKRPLLHQRRRGRRRRAGRGDRQRHRDHRAAGAGAAALAASQARDGRPARWRHRPRFQQPAHRDHRLLRPPPRQSPAERPVLPGHHEHQAERQPGREPGAAAACLLAPPDAQAAGAPARRPDFRPDGAAHAPPRRERQARGGAGLRPVADQGRPRPVRAGDRQPCGQRPRRDARAAAR